MRRGHARRAAGFEEAQIRLEGELTAVEIHVHYSRRWARLLPSDGGDDRGHPPAVSSPGYCIVAGF